MPVSLCSGCEQANRISGSCMVPSRFGDRNELSQVEHSIARVLVWYARCSEFESRSCYMPHISW